MLYICKIVLKGKRLFVVKNERKQLGNVLLFHPLTTAMLNHAQILFRL